MKLYVALLVLVAINSTLAYSGIFAAVRDMLECHDELRIKEDDLLFIDDIAQIQAVSSYTPGQRCSIYCQSEAFGITKQGRPIEEFWRNHPSFANRYDLDEVFANCPYLGANTCEAPVLLAICTQHYPRNRQYD
uniref:Uncharacterized protein n=1 Tax=Glossina brevipalpis TaxID=37001 RepID=A0A1A9W992_9MUSC